MSNVRRPRLVRYFPTITLTILVGCLAGFVLELSLESRLAEFLIAYGFVPLQAAAYVGGVEGTSFVRSILPFFTSLFLHTGLFHLLINVWYLWMLGDVLEAWLGHARYGVLFLTGALMQTLMSLMVYAMAGSGYPGVPGIGISGAIAGLVGGYVVVLVHLLRARRADEEGSLLLWLPVAIGLFGWFPLQLLNRFLSLRVLTCQNSEPVPWFSLIFAAVVVGVMTAMMRPRPPREEEVVAASAVQVSPAPVEPVRWEE